MSRFAQWKAALAVTVALTAAAPAVAQNQTAKEALAQGQLERLLQAQQVVEAANQSGAAQHAASLYDEARTRLSSAQAHWNSEKRDLREEARMHADEAIWAGRAALAKARWLGTNAAIRGLQSDINRFGGRVETIALKDEPVNLSFERGANSKARIAYAQAIVDQAKAVGAEQVPDNDLKPAQQNLETARKIVRNDSQSETADHLAYVAEMMARRATYMVQGNEAGRYLPNLQMERTRLAQAVSEQQAAADRAQREEAERKALVLQQQLAAEQANRQMQAAEVERLRMQVDENRRIFEQRLEADRTARTDAEQRLDALMRQYETALANASTAEVEALRRQVEDQQIALRSVQERERANEQSMVSELERLRAQVSQEELNRRQAELDRLRQEREQAATRAAEMQRQHEASIAEIQRRRQEAEAQVTQLRQEAQANAQQAEANAKQAQEAALEAERVRQQAQATQAELERTRAQLAARESETSQLRMQQELNRIATTRQDPRGLIVTLAGGILFDTGQSALKPGAKSTLTKLADRLKSESAVRIAVEGHTDSVGSEGLNQTLSEKRAAAVREFLVGAGIPTERINSMGKGEATPVATNKSAAGRQQNRRVELVITQ